MNLLPLEQFRRHFSFHPFHFWQLADTDLVPVTTACDTTVYQYAWQGLDAAGRSEIIEAIEEAEGKLRRYLGYRVAPQYVEETVNYPVYNDRRLWNFSEIDADGRWISVQLPEGEIRAIGVESLTAIVTANVVATDEDNDGLDDTFTLTVATTETDPDKIAVYFTSTDRLDSEPASEKWRIRPVQVQISGGVATIIGRYWLLVKPILYEGVSRRALDPTDASNFVTQLEVKTRTTNPNGTTTDNSQAVMIWETAPWPYWWGGACCGSGVTDSSRDPAAVAQAIARVGIRDAKNGVVSVGAAAYNSTDSVWHAIDWSICRPPDRVKVRYLAGLDLEDGQMQKFWQSVVSEATAAEMNRPICACEPANRKLYEAMIDLALSSGTNALLYNLSPEDLNNPIGTRRGHVQAWKRIKHEYITRGFLP